ncbi:MAG: T9SS type A sorting domain-containing protein, partial [Bacteroidota bacterium]
RPIGQPATSTDLLDVLGYTTGVEKNDTTFKSIFPYVQTPWSGFGKCGGPNALVTGIDGYGIGLSAPKLNMLQNYPNPFKDRTTIKYRISENSHVDISIFDLTGKKVSTLINQTIQAGTYELPFNAENLSNGIYIASLSSNGRIVQTMKMSVSK